MANDLITYDLAKPAQTLQLATELQRFVKEQNLTVNIKGKQYPLVESWQFAGSQLGLIPVIQSVQNISTESELKYQAIVDVIRIADGTVVSKGFAVCSNKESNKRQWDEYAICSMAQTRATGKAFRNILGWLMRASGYQATPAEEMDFNKEPNGPTEDERAILRNLVFSSTLDEAGQEMALSSIEACTDYKRYQQLQYRLESLQKPIDQVTNPSQKEINKHLKKSVK